MIEFKDLESPDYRTVSVSGIEPSTDSELPSDHPARNAVSTFIFSNIGETGTDRVKLDLQVNAFNDAPFDGVQPECVLLALLEHYRGLQNSSLQCHEFTAVISQLEDALGILNLRNQRRHYYGVYGTTQPLS